MVQPASLKEMVGSVSPGGSGFGYEGGKATLPFLVDSGDLESAIEFLIGSVERGGDGGLRRTLPAMHPRWPWMACSAITDIRGLMDRSTAGGFTQADAEAELEATPITSYADYPLYRLNCSFEPLPYALLQDDSVDVEVLSYIDEDGNTATAKIASEWVRYTDIDFQGRSETVTAQQGQFKYETGAAGDPDGITFTGRPRIVIPGGDLRILWYRVPFDYLYSSNSYLTKYIGYINQTSFLGYPAGSLLFEPPRILKRYLPLFPALEGLEGEPGVFSLEKYCDLELTFRYTRRDCPDAPGSLSNANWIAGGWNLVPWFGNRAGFWYVRNDDDSTPSNQFPQYLSVPFELLFSDPDV